MTTDEVENNVFDYSFFSANVMPVTNDRVDIECHLNGILVSFQLDSGASFSMLCQNYAKPH